MWELELHILASSILCLSVECMPHMQAFESSVLDRLKPMTYKIDTCHYLAWHSVLIG